MSLTRGDFLREPDGTVKAFTYRLGSIDRIDPRRNTESNSIERIPPAAEAALFVWPSTDGLKAAPFKNHTYQSFPAP
jgi:hypothetical protein